MSRARRFPPTRSWCAGTAGALLAAALVWSGSAAAQAQTAKAKPAVAGNLELPPPPIIIAPPAPQAPRTAAPAPAAGAGAGATCPADDVDTLQQRLSTWRRDYKANERDAYVERHCRDAAVVCLDRFGDALFKLPASVRPGEVLTAKVLVPVVDRGKFAITMSVRAKTAVGAGPFEGAGAPPPSPATNAAPGASCELSPSQRDALQKVAVPIAELASQRGLELLEVPPGSERPAYWSSASSHPFAEWSAWAAAHGGHVPQFTALESAIEVPAHEQTVNVDFTRTEQGETAPSAEHHHQVRIDHGQYYVEASVLVPFVVLGARKATLTPTPSGTELRVGLNEDWHVTGALMVDFFPLGRQKGQISSFDHCRSRSCLENWLGVQIGMGLSSPLEEWYLGLELQPVSGLALGVGASMLKGDFLGPGIAEGMLLPSASSFSVQSNYMFRPYFGLALTTDILETIDRSGIFGKPQ